MLAYDTMSPTMSDLSEWLDKKRREHNWSEADMAREAGLPKETVLISPKGELCY
jgi:hypothetical protein